MSVRSRLLPLEFIEPCQPSSAPKPPAGPDWLHEIKHDGFRLMAWRDGECVRLFTRRGNDWSERYPAVAAALRALKVRACLIDGEVVVCNENGVASFGRLRSREHDGVAFLYAFDLLTLDGQDLRREPIETRKATLASLLRKAPLGLTFCDHLEGDGKMVFQHACRMGLEGIVSKRRGSGYTSGPSAYWLKSKNPASEAVRRKGSEVWG